MGDKVLVLLGVGGGVDGGATAPPSGPAEERQHRREPKGFEVS